MDVNVHVNVIYAHKTLYGFQNLDIHNKLIGEQLYVVHAICSTMIQSFLSRAILDNDSYH